MDSSSPPLQPHESNLSGDPIKENGVFPTCNDGNSTKPIKKKKNKNKLKNASIVESSDQQHPLSNSLFSSTASSASCSTTSHSTRRSSGFTVSNRIRNPRSALSGRRNESDVGALALPIGMSIAAVLSQVLEQKDGSADRMSVDHLSKIKHLTYREVKPTTMIFTLAIGESLDNVFGDKYDCFINNFEKSFRSTLMTLRVVNESSQSNRGVYPRELNKDKFCSDPTSRTSLNREGNSTCHSREKYCQSEVILNNVSDQEESDASEENEVNTQPDLTNRSLSLHEGYISQQLVSSPNSLPFTFGSMHNTLERSVIEQSRSNDLKTFEIGLIMKKMQLKEAQLAINSDSNFLERFKLSMGMSKASFKAEKFKTELKDARHAELLKTCIDCLVAGLLIMLAALAYGTYVYSHQRIIDATAACAPAPESKSWWIPNPVSSISSGLHILRCQVQAVFRMLFGVLMILSIVYLLLQRPTASRQAMPVTFILLLLGVGCGFAGKFCVDTLGGSGNHWLFYWEALCLLHFFSNIWTSALFFILNGPITVTERSKSSRIFPHWIRRFLFYSIALVVLPLLCGFIPFASPSEWRDHFSLLILGSPETEIYNY